MSKKGIDTSHQTILKAISIFGSTHVIRILINLVANKFITIFLGPSGLGILSLIKSTVEIIKSISDFGLNLVAVREVSLIDQDKDIEKAETFFILKRIAIYTGVFGGVLMILFSGILSNWTFGTSDKFHWYIGLSGYFIISNLVTYKESILQGFRLLKKIALVSLFSALFTAIIAVVLYYFFGSNGIVPVLLLGSLVKLLVITFYTKSYRYPSFKLDFKALLKKLKPLLSLGFLLSINVIFGKVCVYLIKMYLNHTDPNSENLGYYEAAMIILVSYLGMIFSAMVIDFYPRLTAIQNDNVAVRKFVNNQIEIAILIITPSILIFYSLDEWIIKMLYNEGFIPTVEILTIGLLSLMVRAVIWPLGFVLLAKGDKRPYFFTEIVGDFLQVVLTIVLYNYFGLIGIGAGILISFIIYGIIVGVFIKVKYNFNLAASLKTLIVCFVFGVLGCVFKTVLDFSFIGLITVCLLSVMYSLYLLNKKIGFLSIFK
ncbi:oligosaccharide flippase family protein [Aquimarina sp. M1]